MAMMRPRRPTFRTQPSFRPLYQDFKPKSDMTENPEAHILHIHLPGFTKERIRVQYDDSSQMLKVSGERPIDGGNRRSRFREAYQVPQNCIMNKIQSNFRQGILTIVMPKKIIISPAEVKSLQEQEQELAGPSQKAEQAVPPPKSATQQQEEITRDDKKTASSSSSPSSSGTGPGDMKAQEKIQEKIPSQKSIVDMQKQEKELAMEVAEKKADDGMPQKVKEETEPKPTLKLDEGKVEDEKPQKVQQEIEPKPKLEISPRNKMDEKPPQKGKEETEPELISETVPRKPLDENPERGQEVTDQNATLTSTPGKRSGEKTDAEKERTSGKEIIEEGKHSKSRKIENGVKALTERRELAKADELSVPKVPEKEKETNSKPEAAAAAAAKESNVNDDMIGTIGKGIKEVTGSASKAFTRIAEGKWDHEDKPLLLNMGASVLVLTAMGVYALYRFSSS